MKKKAIAIMIALVAVLGFYILFVGNPFYSTPATTMPQYQVLFVGENSNQTKAVRNSTVTGSFELNMTQPSQLKLTLGEEKYYPHGFAGNNSTPFTLVDSFQNGSVSFGGATFVLGTMRDCTATATSTQTVGNTIKEEVTCNASTVSPQIGTEIHVTSAGISQFGYSIHVPANATAGTYLVNILVQGSSIYNFADQSGNLVYVLSVSVTG